MYVNMHKGGAERAGGGEYVFYTTGMSEVSTAGKGFDFYKQDGSAFSELMSFNLVIYI